MKFGRVNLTCEQHGDRPWNGEVVCAKCGEVYQTADDKKPRFAPMVCKCGARLMPNGVALEESARACCTKCYEHKTGEPSPPSVDDPFQVRLCSGDGTTFPWGQYQSEYEAQVAYREACERCPTTAIEVLDLHVGRLWCNPLRTEQLEKMKAILGMRAAPSEAPAQQPAGAGPAASTVVLRQAQAKLVEFIAATAAISIDEAHEQCIDAGFGVMAARLAEPSLVRKVIEISNQVRETGLGPDPEAVEAIRSVFGGDIGTDLALRGLGLPELAEKMRRLAG